MNEVPAAHRTKLSPANILGGVSRAFREYLQPVEIKHILAAPNHPPARVKLDRHHRTQAGMWTRSHARYPLIWRKILPPSSMTATTGGITRPWVVLTRSQASPPRIFGVNTQLMLTPHSVIPAKNLPAWTGLKRQSARDIVILGGIGFAVARPRAFRGAMRPRLAGPPWFLVGPE